jgi:hypothetical protein
MNHLVKIVVTVPENDADQLRQAIGKAEGGTIGSYIHCSFSIKGVGRFLPTEGARPAIGSVGSPEQVEEERIEVTCHKDAIGKVVDAIRTHHPYEEPVIDVYPLLDI